MKIIHYIFIILLLSNILHANMLDTLKEKTKNIGKKTPINIALYAKNPSQICSLAITNISNPYKKDLTSSKLIPIELDVGRYYRDDVSNLLKGTYEFEYKWEKEGEFIDSRLRTIHVFAYHDIRNRVHKKVNLTFLLSVPKECK